MDLEDRKQCIDKLHWYSDDHIEWTRTLYELYGDEVPVDLRDIVMKVETFHFIQGDNKKDHKKVLEWLDARWTTTFQNLINENRKKRK
jgi:hypothetical protein